MKIVLGITLSLIAVFYLSSCSREFLCETGDGKKVTEERSIQGFDGIDMQLAGDVTINQGNSYKVSITGDRNVVAAITNDIRNGVWRIKFDKGCYQDYDLSVEVTVPDLSMAAMSGTGSIFIQDFTDQSELDLVIAGSGNIHVNKFDGAYYINSVISGSGKIIANDSVQVHETDIVISGSGEYKAYPWSVSDCEIKVSGSADCYVNVSSDLDIVVSGSADIYYKGNPKIYQNVSGALTLVNDN